MQNDLVYRITHTFLRIMTLLKCGLDGLAEWMEVLEGKFTQAVGLRQMSVQTLTACVATQSVFVLCRPADTDCLCRDTVSVCVVPACRH